jgi:hypothetical protein
LRRRNPAKQDVFLFPTQRRPAYHRFQAVQLRLDPFHPAVYPLHPGRYIGAGYGKPGAVSICLSFDFSIF